MGQNLLEEYEEQFIGYNEWARETLDIRIAHDFVYQNTTDSDDRGVYCDLDIEPHETLVAVPFESLLTTASIEHNAELSSILNDFDLREDDQLAIFILYEKLVLKSDSKWAKHLEIVPESFHNLMYFSPTQLEALRGSNTYHIGIQLQKQVADDYQQLNESIFPRLRETCGELTLEQYKWALSVIYTRFISIERAAKPYKAMAPVLDMFNHDPTAQMSHRFNPEADELQLISHQRWAAGQQVCINYGPLPNSRLLTLYGFVIPENPYHSVDIWAPMSPDAPDYLLKRQILQRHVIFDSQEPFSLTLDGLNEQLLACLRIQRMNDAELPKSHLAFQGMPLSDENEQQVLSALIEALKHMLEQYKDSDRVKESQDEHIEMAKVLCEADRQVLQTHLDLLQARDIVNH